MASKDAPHRLEYLLEATRNLRNALDLEAYLQLVAEAAAELTDSEASSMLVADEFGHQSAFCRSAADPVGCDEVAGCSHRGKHCRADFHHRQPGNRNGGHDGIKSTSKTSIP